ncbi:hypothetical protein GWK47_047667 [Chionoecetes opilio]|uniref:Peptidase A2 domain-containing protein n=1 Tax=Chionoecetes opilio TaxID=41210 RepID=A0A8J4Y580_CHIOP|nr:hypothetical protein GWK47_047667 [Chionoecetes opilio]
MESFLRTSREVEGPTHRPRTMFKARKGHVQSPSSIVGPLNLVSRWSGPSRGGATHPPTRARSPPSSPHSFLPTGGAVSRSLSLPAALHGVPCQVKVTGEGMPSARHQSASPRGSNTAGTSTSRVLGLWAGFTALLSVHKTGTLPTGRPRETLSGWSGGPTPASLREAPFQTVQRDPGQVNGRPSLTVDTGAERTFVQAYLVDTFRTSSHQTTVCAGSPGPCTKLRGPVQAIIEVGEPKEELPVYVADLDENLLGLEFLHQARRCGPWLHDHAGQRGEVTLQGCEKGCAGVDCTGLNRVVGKKETRDCRPNLQDFWQRSGSCLTRGQAAKVGQLLEQYVDVFLRRVTTTFGRTGLAQHVSTRATAGPLKQPLGG